MQTAAQLMKKKFLRVRYVGGVKYLDYIADFDSLSPQTVEYGKNLLA